MSLTPQQKDIPGHRSDDDDLGPPPPPPPSIDPSALPPNAVGDTAGNNISNVPAAQAGQRCWDCTYTHDVAWGKTQQGEQTVNEYVLLGELGRGSFGRVQLCERRVGEPPWRRFAMKIMSKPRLRRLSEYVNVPTGGMRKVTAEDKMRQEIEIMRHLFHRSIVLLFEVLEEHEDWEDSSGQNEGRVCMILEYMEGGPTMTFDDETGRFSRPAGAVVGGAAVAGSGDGNQQVYTEDEAKPLFRDLVQGLLYLHGEGIVHRDIKPDNLLLFENGTLRICDFGCARRVQITRRAPAEGGQGRKEEKDKGEEEEEEEEEGLTNSVGTYAFHSPESLTGDGAPYSGRRADAWAAACTLYCWTFGCLPFHDESLERLFEKIRTEELDVGKAVSPEFASLLKGMMLRKNLTQRIGLQAILEHPWMKGVPPPPPPAGFDPNA